MYYQKPSRFKQKKVIISISIAVVVVIASITGYFIYKNYQYTQDSKPITTTSELVLFETSSTDTIEHVAAALEDQKIIKKASVFLDVAESKGVSSVLEGQFALDRSWTNAEILASLIDPESPLDGVVNIMFPPGYWAKDVAHKLANLTHLDEQAILDAWNDATYVKELQGEYSFLTDEVFQTQAHVLLEGYLYPETYQFLIDTTIDDATHIILNQTQVIYERYAQQFAASSYTVHQLFTLASIVNYEAATPEDMKMVAQIFYNRLNQNMKLQSSVTVCYALYTYANWQECESSTDIDSPYNTYLHEGLPIGPVMNPTETALEAVFNPTPNEYLYFVADIETGELHYAKTYEEHLKNVELYVDAYR